VVPAIGSDVGLYAKGVVVAMNFYLININGKSI
jgi:hypothetical protein